MSRCFQLSLSEVAQVVIGFSHQLFGAHIGIDHKSTARDQSWKPLTTSVAGRLLSHWDIASLEATDSTPVRNVHQLDSGHQNFENTSAQVMRKQHVWIELMEFSNEPFDQLALCMECHNVRVSTLLELLLKVMRPRSLIEFTDEGETLHFLTVCRSILVDFVMNKARNHGDLVRVLGGTTSLEAERHAGHWRGWLV